MRAASYRVTRHFATILPYVLPIVFGMLAVPVKGQSWVINVDQELERTRLVLPYAFYTESFGLAYGVGGAVTGLGQGQAVLGAAVLKSTRGAKGVYFIADDYRLADRLYTRLFVTRGWYRELRGYLSPSELPGDAPSVSEQGYIEADGDDDVLEWDLKYVLPLGSAKDTGLHRYYTERGYLQRQPLGGQVWDPRRSGRTLVDLQVFAQHRSYELASGTLPFSSNGLALSLEYDNRDFEINPRRGSYQRVRVEHDFGFADSTQSWTTLDLDLRKYLPLNWLPETFEQDVLALRAWWIDTPSWEVQEDGRVAHRPPHFMGASLGGWNDMRGFDSGRFNDRAAAYYSAEYRVMPRWNPLSDWRLPLGMKIDWWQFTGFVEAAQVAGTWDMGALHEDMHISAGAGARIYVAEVLIRMDAAFSEEGAHLWVMVGQTF